METITVNGEEWGLYLAVEAVEESFLQRNYGNDYGELYKPDSMSFGGGRGNGMNFDMEEFDFEASGDTDSNDVQNNFKGHGGKGGFSFENIDEETVRKALEDQGVDTSILEDFDFDNATMESIQELLSKIRWY